MRPPRIRLVIVVAAVAVFAGLFQVAHLERARVEPRQEEGNRLTNVSILARSYAQANGGLWPPLDTVNGRFELPRALVPEGYALQARFDHKTTTMPEALLLGRVNNHKAYQMAPFDAIGDYYYVGYAVASSAEATALLSALRSGKSTRDDIPVTAGSGTLGSSTLYMLRSNLAETLAHDGVAVDPAAFGRIPALIGKPANGRIWVLYLNNHVAYAPFPGDFPLTTEFIAMLDAGISGPPETRR